jgi:hypothetical protein
MEYGRIVRVTYTLGGPYVTYIVAEEDAAKAAAMMRTQVGADANVECIGRASKQLLLAIGLSAGEFKKADPNL